MIHITVPYNGSHKDLVKRVFNCKVCMRLLWRLQAEKLGRYTSRKKAKSSRANGKLGGRPRNSKYLRGMFK